MEMNAIGIQLEKRPASRRAQTIDWKCRPVYGRSRFSVARRNKKMRCRVVSYGYYEETVLLLTQITPTASFTDEQAIPVASDAIWLECEALVHSGGRRRTDVADF